MGRVRMMMIGRTKALDNAEQESGGDQRPGRIERDQAQFRGGNQRPIATTAARMEKPFRRGLSCSAAPVAIGGAIRWSGRDDRAARTGYLRAGEVSPCHADARRPVALLATEAPPRPFRTNYPEPFASRMAGRDKRPLWRLVRADEFRRQHHPDCAWRLLGSAPCAYEARTSSFISSKAARPWSLDAGRTALHPGMCAGFKAGRGDAHCLVNETGADVVYLEIGGRTAGDAATTLTTTSPW